MEEGFVLQRHSHNPADHVDRQRIGVIIDDVDPGLAFGLVEQSLTMRTHSGSMLGISAANEAGRSAASPGGATGRERAGRS